MAKSSAVIEVVGGDGGGKRRELNVLKRLHMSGALLFLLWKYEQRKMKAKTDTYSGLTDLLICAIFSLLSLVRCSLSFQIFKYHIILQKSF